MCIRDSVGRGCCEDRACRARRRWRTTPTHGQTGSTTPQQTAEYDHKQSYLRIYWTDFHDFFTKMKGICVDFLDPDQFFRFLQGRCHGNQFCVVAEFFARSQSISGFAGLIFTIFAPYGWYWIADDQSDLLFPISLGTLSCNQFCGKIT